MANGGAGVPGFRWGAFGLIVGCTVYVSALETLGSADPATMPKMITSLVNDAALFVLPSWGLSITSLVATVGSILRRPLTTP